MLNSNKAQNIVIYFVGINRSIQDYKWTKDPKLLSKDYRMKAGIIAEDAVSFSTACYIVVHD